MIFKWFLLHYVDFMVFCMCLEILVGKACMCQIKYFKIKNIGYKAPEMIMFPLCQVHLYRYSRYSFYSSEWIN